MPKLPLLLLSAAVLTLSATSCSKDKQPVPTTQATIQPRDYQVELRVSSSTDSTSEAIVYINETGAYTTIATSTRLPVVYKYKRNMKLANSTAISASLPGGTAASEITATILLDGKQVKQATARGARANVAVAYVIGE